MPHPTVLNREQTALVVVDLQEAFRSPIPDFPLIAERTSIAVRGFQILNIPVFVTEQYPRGLGATVEEIRYSLPDDFEYIEKTAFSSCGARLFQEKLKAANVTQVVLCGVETHVCVSQTAHDLLTEAFAVHVLTDCVSARFSQDKETALRKMQMNGVVPSTIEMALFELLRDAKHEQFKEIQALVK